MSITALGDEPKASLSMQPKRDSTENRQLLSPLNAYCLTQ